MSRESESTGATLLCDVLRSPRREGMYLLVDRREQLARVPDALLAQFGEPQHAMTFKLYAGRRMARVDAAEVLRAIAEQGFYLQLPPTPGADPAAGAAVESSPSEEGQGHAD